MSQIALPLVHPGSGEQGIVVGNANEAAIDALQAACRPAGFAGLTLIGEDRGFVPATLDRMAALGLDASFAYCWHLPGSPAADAVARELIRSSADSTQSRRSKGCSSMSMRPASILEKSRMSLSKSIIERPESWIISA